MSVDMLDPEPDQRPVAGNRTRLLLGQPRGKRRRPACRTESRAGPPGILIKRSYWLARRSASQTPAQSPPFQEPPPAAPARRPEPIAFLLPWLTVTVMEPLPPTLPEMLIGLSPALTSEPLEIRIGYR